MCGQFGAAGFITAIERKVITTLAWMDYLRGKDSTGLAVVDRTNHLFLDRETGSPFWLFNKGGKKHPFLDDNEHIKIDASVILGHNRAATVGSITPKNAHPFFHTPVVGTMNGTLAKQWIKNFDDYEKFDVDSEAVIFNIAKYGAEAIKKMTGGYAIVWYNLKEKKLYFIRGPEKTGSLSRPLFYTRRVDKDVLFWASESWMLREALKHHHISHSEIIEFEPNKLYTLDVSACDFKFRNAEMKVGETIMGFSPPTPVITASGGKTKETKITTTSGGRTHTTWVPISVMNNGGPVLTRNPFQNNNKVVANHGYDWDIYALRSLVDHSLEFTIGKVHESPTGGGKYLDAFSVKETDTFAIRIYAENNSKLWKRLVGSASIWKAKVKKAVRLYTGNGKYELYILPDNRTLEESIQIGKKENNPAPLVSSGVLKDIPKVKPHVVASAGTSATSTSTTTSSSQGKPTSSHFSKKPIMGYGYRLLTLPEWYINTSDGCAYCSTDADIQDHDKLYWTDDKSFICPDCQENPDVRKYLGNLDD